MTITASAFTALGLAAAAGASPIYHGRVFDRDAADDGAAPVYTYERRVGEDSDGEGLVASHLTRDGAGRLLIDETARVSRTYALRRFEADNRQQRYQGTATVSADGMRIDFVLTRDGRTRQASEALAAPAVAGPSLHGFILQHWDRLVAGGSVDLRMIVIDRATTLGFRARLEAHDGERTVFSVTPTNWLVRFALAPLRVAFDSGTRQVVRYEGRVPPLRIVDGRERAFDARVDYTMRAAAYR